MTQQRADLVVREPDEAPPPFHRTRRSILDNEAAWRLAEDALERVVDGVVEHRVPYGDIAEFRLSYDPTRFETNRYRCDIRTASGVRALIVSVSYVSLANFDDRSKTYLPFVRALTERVARANPDCRFRAGRPLFRHLAGQAFLLLMLLLLVSVLYVTGVPPLGVVTIKLALIAFFVPTLIRYTRVNRPRPFDPGDVPSDVLPRT